ncbi:methyltransferase [Virgisporangium ochraceum]
MTRPLLDPDGIAALRGALEAAHYTGPGIAERLGNAAVQAIQRGDYRPALRATGSGDPLDTLIRLFICGQSESASVVEAALPLALPGFLERDGDGVRAAVELEPYGDWWVLSDLSTSLRPGLPLAPDHVLGVGGASSTLAQATIREPVDSALDLGTGCGVQALHLSGHAHAVTATDLSERALRFAATTAALNDLNWDLRLGDLAGPVRGERFDLVVSNPPFVVGPGSVNGGATHTYRDSGRPGDQVCAELVRLAPSLLNDGGTMQFLANWAHVAGEDWEDRVNGWLVGTGLDAWVIQREVSDPVAYVNLWLADAGQDPQQRADWLDWFDAQKIEAVGLGLITLRAGGHDDPTVRLEDLRQQVEQPFGPHVAAWFSRQDWLRAHPAPRLLEARLKAVDGLTLRQDASRTDDGWQVDRQRLALTGGLRWVDDVDPVTLALVGGCDGSLTLRDQVDLLAAAHEVDPSVLADAAVPLVAHLVERGYLEPASGPASPGLRSAGSAATGATREGGASSGPEARASGASAKGTVA